MQRRRFIEMGGLLAATAAQLNSFAGIPQNKKSGDNERKIDFIYDGTELAPKEYAGLLMKLVDEGKIKIDNYSKGGIVEELENKFATLLGKESAVFMPTGTLANHIAVRNLAGNNRRIIVQEQSHFYNDSGDCAETLSGLNLITTGYNAVDFSVTDVINIANQTKTGRVETRIGVIAIETPVRRKQDRIFTYEKIKPVCDYAKSNGIKTHLDGARLFVQAAHTDIAPGKYGELFDTVYTSMYKCFNAPCGAILAGTKQFTESLFHERRMFGGGLPASWPFAAIALYYADTFMSDYKAAWLNAQKFFSILEKEERFTISELENGTHVVRLEVKGKDINRFRDSLAKKNVELHEPVKNGFFLKINPTINRIQPEALAELFLDSLDGKG
ncbi:threonine aldolase family protein [Flavihumibacter fluvii]|uniref:threonine aldolase family protein n=1 Tax=Flavihumibacter fluvii TaxID=2838157 RepID=UPI001BDF26C7|nr:beta-eliminating lyase-related protein [Flavihumibacter fluvii]ULQ54310.1 beta-eliminating lyase-related protein [Flavihumibacter fluvii]